VEPAVARGTLAGCRRCSRPLRNRQALKDILGFWLEHGVAGFRVDMAFSLVKDDPGHAETVALWREIRGWLEANHPDAVIIPEGVEPRAPAPDGGTATRAFHADFFLVIHASHATLFDNHAAGVLPWQRPVDPFFDAEGRGSTATFLQAWGEAKATDPARPVLISTADHDFDRLRCGPCTPDQFGTALTFLFTWGSVPCLYYGDEIGMQYLPGMPDIEGAICHLGYNRAGCRTPMQWDHGPKAGFSTASPEHLYLPVDPSPDRPTVAGQLDDPDSTLHLVRRLIALRRATPALGARAGTTVLHEGYPFTYLRGNTHLVVVNPSREPATVTVPGVCEAAALLADGVQVGDSDEVRVQGFGYGVFELAPRTERVAPTRARTSATTFVASDRLQPTMITTV
jgi:maltose alpha-D-glucosyltransferase/alpha-amylase